MPQLDKYIFFNHVVTLTIFFCLIYIFIRKSVVPQISTTLKYRKKKIGSFNSGLEDYKKAYNFSKIDLETKGKTFSNQIFENLDSLVSFYNKRSNQELSKIYDSNSNLLKQSSISAFLVKNRKEFKRLNDTQ
jgi:hypothetical protein|tara:strand:- start:1961 stop:2356 length:396 start_codon:yes stop_codon:yes gene_type:complete